MSGLKTMTTATGSRAARQRSLESVQIPATPLDLPEYRLSEKMLAALTFVVSVAYLCLFRRYTSIEPDEGIVLQGAQRILHGQVPYRDFFTFLTPGSFYLHALMFKVFGNSFLVARTTLACCGALISTLVYLLARRTCSRAMALLVAGVS